MIVRVSTATVFVLTAALSFTPSARAVDIAVSGFNEDVVLEKGSTSFAHRFDGILWCWVEQGYGAQTGSPGADGLPSSRQFTSGTGSGIVYHLQPYDANNVLRLGDDDPLTGTLTVVPGRYSILHLLSATGVGRVAAPTNIDLTLNFADGSITLPGGLFTHDWTWTNRFVPGALPPIAITMHDRGQFPSMTPTSSSAIIDHRPDPEFALYETPVNLTQLGLDGRVLESITFHDPAPATGGTIGIFAVDGTVPEPGAGGILCVVAALCLRFRRPQ